MGHAFKNIPKEFYVSTKSSKKDGSELRRQLEISLKRLSVNKINFFHIWCILNLDNYKSRMVKDGAYVKYLAALRIHLAQ
jgi:predicted aldo/keto reductase-like oxidoreductase